MLQRCGRTGRKRQGKICLLINEGKEEEAVKAARRSYKNVQNSIIDGTKLDMYNGELAGVIPADCKPTCSKMELVIADIEEKVVKMKKSVTAGKAYLDDEQEKDYIRRFMSDDVVLKKFQLNNHLIWQTSELPVIEMPRSEKSSTFVSLMEYFEDIKGTEAPPQISEKFMKSSQSQRVSNGMPGIKRRVIATLGPSSSFSSDIDVPEHVVKDRKEEDRLHDMLVLHSDDDLLPEFLKTETSKNKPEISVLTGDKCAKYPSYEMLSQDISAIDVEEPEILPNLNCRKECPEVQAIEESMYLSDFSGFESVDISHRRTSVDIAQIEVENNELQGGEMNADPNETVVYSDFEFDDIDLEQIENQYLGPKTVEQAPNSNLIKLPASIPKTPNFSAIKPFTILSTPNVGNKIDMAKRKAAPPLPILMTPVVGSSFKRFKPDKAQPLAMLSTPEVQSSLDNSVFVQQRRSRNNIVLSSNSHASPAVYKNDDPISSSEDEEKITGLRKLLLEKRRKAPRAAPKEREFKIPFKTTHSESVGPPKPRKKRRKNIKAFEMGLIDVEVSVTSDTGTSEEFTGSEYDSDLSGFIAHSQVHDTPGFYRKDLALNGRSDAAKFVPKPAQPLPFSARANPATEDSLGSLADFVNDEIVYSDQSGILPEDQNTQDFEDSLGRSEIGLEISAKPSPCRKAIEDLDVDDMFDF